MTGVSSKKGGSTLFSAGYTRDSANQLTSDNSAASGTGSYKYTPLNQVCYAGSSNSNACSSPPTGSIAYKYDAADNLTQKGSTQQAFNNADELCWTASTSSACSTPPSGATTYQYDTRGNRTNVAPNGGQAQTLTYDQANGLAKFAAASTTSYGYNGDGLRMCKYVGSSSQPCQQTGATQFLWDMAGSLPALIKDGTTAYVYGPGGLPVEQVNTSATYWLHHDQLGSTRVITDSSGNTQATYTFDPYGGLASSTGTIINPFRFCGQYQDAESGLYYLRARYYDAASGQFASFDPGTGSSRSPYAYVAGNPINSGDPTGLIGGAICANYQWSSGVSLNYHPCIGFTFNTNTHDFHVIVATTVPTWSLQGLPNTFGSPNASISVTGQINNAQEPADLKGVFAYAGGSLGDYTGEYFTSGGKHPIQGCEFGMSGGWPPAEVHGGQSETVVLDVTDPFHIKHYA
jgi:RHS repeat-associated protein